MAHFEDSDFKFVVRRLRPQNHMRSLNLNMATQALFKFGRPELLVHFHPKRLELVFSKQEKLDLEDLRTGFYRLLHQNQAREEHESFLLCNSKIRDSRSSRVSKIDYNIYGDMLLKQKRFSVRQNLQVITSKNSGSLMSSIRSKSSNQGRSFRNSMYPAKKNLGNLSMLRPKGGKKSKNLLESVQTGMVILKRKNKRQELHYSDLFRWFRDPEKRRLWDDVARIFMKIPSRRPKVIVSVFDKDQMHYDMFLRAWRYVEVLFREIPPISMEFICSADEARFEKNLFNISPKVFCEYMTYKLHIYIQKNCAEELTKFETEWSISTVRTGPSSLFLTNVRIFQISNLDSKRVFDKSECSVRPEEEELNGISNFVHQKLFHKLKRFGVCHLERVDALSSSYGLNLRHFLNHLLLKKRKSLVERNVKESELVRTGAESLKPVRRGIKGFSEKDGDELIKLIYLDNRQELLGLLQTRKFVFENCYSKVDFILSKKFSFFKLFVEKKLAKSKHIKRQRQFQVKRKANSRRRSQMARRRWRTLPGSFDGSRVNSNNKSSKNLLEFLTEEKEKLESKCVFPEKYYDQMRALMKGGYLLERKGDFEQAKSESTDQGSKGTRLSIISKPEASEEKGGSTYTIKLPVIDEQKENKKLSMDSNQIQRNFERQTVKTSFVKRVSPMNLFVMKYVIRVKKNKKNKLQQEQQEQQEQRETQPEKPPAPKLVKKRSSVETGPQAELWTNTLIKDTMEKLQMRRNSVLSALKSSIVSNSRRTDSIKKSWKNKSVSIQNPKKEKLKKKLKSINVACQKRRSEKITRHSNILSNINFDNSRKSQAPLAVNFFFKKSMNKAKQMSVNKSRIKAISLKVSDLSQANADKARKNLPLTYAQLKMTNSAKLKESLISREHNIHKKSSFTLH